MSFKIRKVREGDEITLTSIHTESWKSAFASILSEDILKKYTDFARVQALYAQLLKENKGQGYLLEVDGQGQALAWWDKSREEDMPEHAELICIHSLPHSWGKGYGLQLMYRILEDMKQAGYAQVMLWVFKENTRAIQFYEKLGFKFKKRTKQFLDKEEVLMVKRFK